VRSEKLLEARHLRRQGGVILFDRVRLLCEVFDDRDFRADQGNLDDLRAAQVLDAEVDDTGFDFLQLREIYQANTDPDTWGTTNLADLYEAVLEARRKAGRPQAPIRRRQVIRRQEYDELQSQLSETETKLQRAEIETEVLRRRTSELDTLRAELADARRNIAQLERENADLRKRLSERESMATNH